MRGRLGRVPTASLRGWGWAPCRFSCQFVPLEGLRGSEPPHAGRLAPHRAPEVGGGAAGQGSALLNA